MGYTRITAVLFFALLFQAGVVGAESPTVAQWDLDEGAGSSVADITGSGHTGSVVGAQWVSDTPSGSGSALNFDGVDDYVDVGGIDVAGEALTIALWFKADSFAVSDARLISKATGTSSRKHHWMLSTISSGGSKLRFRLRAGSSTSTLIATSGNLVPGVWTHAAVVYDGASMRIYKDGALVGSMPKTGVLATDSGVLAAIGNQPPGAGNVPFDGAIDDVQIHSRALSASESQGPAGGSPPNAVIDMPAGNVDIAVGGSVVFSATGTDPDAEFPLTYLWDFDEAGSGVAPSTLEDPGAVLFGSPGVFTVRLTATDSSGQSDPTPDTITVTVIPPNNAPDSAIDTPSGSIAIVAGESVSFSGTGSDVDATYPLTYAWDFDEAGSGVAPSMLEDPGAVLFAVPGIFTITLTVTDAALLADSTPAAVTVFVQLPPMLVDNEDPEFVPAGTWFIGTDPPEYMGSNYLYSDGGAGADTATWSFTVLSAGTYSIAAQWVAEPSNATDAPFTIYNNGMDLGTVRVDQTRSGGALNPLDLFDLSAGSLEVVLSNDANGRVIADAVEVSETAFRITEPVSGSVVTVADVPVTMQTLGLPPQWGVEFVVDATSAVQTYTQPFGTVLSGLSVADHTVEAFVIDPEGGRVSGLATSAPFSIGNYFVAFGGGITDGFGDDISTDNTSLDGRNIHTGYAPILNNLLTASQKDAHNIETEGMDLSLAADEALRVIDVLAAHPSAQSFLILGGMADALNEATPSGAGLSYGDPGYASSYKDSMHQIASAVLDDGRESLISKLPMCVGDYSGAPFPDPSTVPLNLLIQDYNRAIDEVVTALSLTPGPDLYSHFEANPGELFDDCYPNGVGYQSIAYLWHAALTGTSTEPTQMDITAAFADCGVGGSSNVNSCAVPYPPGVEAGDELLIWLGIDSNPDDMNCTNFERLVQRQGGAVGLAVFRRTATGNHTGTEDCTWDAGDLQSGGAIMTRVTGATRLRPPLTSFDGIASTTSDPPAIPIPVADTLVVTACAHDGGRGNVSDPPSGYTELLDGIGCDNSGCVDTSLATRMVSSAGFEDPGPFTNWNRSDESACITLGYDKGTVTEPVFAINWDATSSPASCAAEGAIRDQGSNDCNCRTGNCPLPQGGESVSILAQRDGQNKELGFTSAYGAMAGVSSGCMIVDFEVNFDTFSTTSNTSFFELTSGQGNAGAEIRYLNRGNVLGIRCDDHTLGSMNYALTEDENYKVRLEYCIDGGPGLCAGNTPGCTDCGCLYVETASSGNPYGTTQIDACNGSGSMATIPINGWYFSMSAGTLDLIADDLAVCDANPAPGDKCGK